MTQEMWKKKDGEKIKVQFLHFISGRGRVI